MASGDSVAVKIGADASGFRAGAEEARDQTRALIEAMKALTDAMAKQSHGTREAKEEVTGLSAKLREFKSEHTQTARATRFFSNEIEHLGLVSGEASGAIGTLIAGFAVGGGVGVAVGAMKLIVEGVHSIGEESRKEAEELKKLAEASKVFIESQAQSLEDFLAALERETEAQKIARKEALPLLLQETNLTGQLSAARTALQTATEEQVIDEQGLARQMFEQARATKEITSLEAQLTIVRANLAGVRKRVGGTGAGEDAAADDAASTAAASARRKQIEESINDVLRKHGEVQSYVNGLDQASIDLEKEKIKNILSDAAEEQAAIKKENDEKSAEAAAEIAGEMQLKRDAEEEAEALAEAEAKKLAGELAHAARRVGEEFGSVLGEMVRGTKSLDDAIGDMLQSLLKAVAQLAAMQLFMMGGPLGILGGIGIEAVGGALGGLFGGGGGGGNSTTNINMVNHFAGAPGDSAQFQTAVIRAVQAGQRRGRL